MSTFLDDSNKSHCFGCEACVQVCGKAAITMEEDQDGFRYPLINVAKCVDCGVCRKVCPYDNMPQRFGEDKYVFGGYSLDMNIDSSCVSDKVIAPELIQELISGENLIWMRSQEVKKLQLFRRHIQGCSVKCNSIV